MQKAAGAIDEMLALEELASGHTSVHRLHPLSKLLVTVLYVVTVISVNRLDFVTLSIFFFYPAVLTAAGGIPFRAIAKRLLAALPFVLFMGLSNILFETEAYTVVLGLAVSRGLVSFIVLTEKTVLTVSAVLLLMATTKAPQIFACLRGLGLPKILTILLMLSLRYLSVLLGEADRMMRAYRLRSFKAKGIQMRDMGSFAGQLLLRSFDRAEHIYKAMKLRGFSGDFPLGADIKMNAASFLYMLAAAASIVFFRFVSIMDIMALFG